MKPISQIITAPKVELQIIENSKELLKNLNNEELEIIKAQNEGILIGAMDSNQLIELSKRIVKTANAKLGITSVTDEDLELNIELIYGDLASFKGNTDKIILQALKSGLNGDFSNDGKVFFSSSAFVIWVKKFITDKKMPTLAKFQQNKAIAERETPKPIPSDESRKSVLNEIIEDHKNKVLEDFDFDFIFDCGELYGELEKLGIFQFSINEKFEIYENAKKMYPNLNDIEVRKKSKHMAWVKYILKLISE